MSRYKRITLYYNMEDSQDGLRYALINSLSTRKKSLFDKMLDSYLETYGISNIEDLTLKDLQEISRLLMGKEEVKEKRGRGRPRKVVESSIRAEPKVDVEVEEIKEIKNENALTETKPKRNIDLEEAGIKTTEEPKEYKKEVSVQKLNKPNKNPMSFNIDDDDDDGGIDPALLGELDAFNL